MGTTTREGTGSYTVANDAKSSLPDGSGVAYEWRIGCVSCTTGTGDDGEVVSDGRRRAVQLQRTGRRRGERKRLPRLVHRHIRPLVGREYVRDTDIINIDALCNSGADDDGFDRICSDTIWLDVVESFGIDAEDEEVVEEASGKQRRRAPHGFLRRPQAPPLRAR